MEKALFGAGCFWGVEEYFSNINGVTDTEVGYSGGNIKNPTYESVCNNNTGHVEVVKIIYNVSIISYKKLLDNFWQCHDPTTLNRQGPDIGEQYKSSIFYFTEFQQKLAIESKNRIQKNFANKIVTEIIKYNEFYKAEEYHQKYISKTGSRCEVKYE